MGRFSLQYAFFLSLLHEWDALGSYTWCVVGRQTWISREKFAISFLILFCRTACTFRLCMRIIAMLLVIMVLIMLLLPNWWNYVNIILHRWNLKYVSRTWTEWTSDNIPGKLSNCSITARLHIIMLRMLVESVVLNSSIFIQEKYATFFKFVPVNFSVLKVS